MSRTTIYPRQDGLTRWLRCVAMAVAPLMAIAAGGCAFPVSLPLAQFAGLSGAQDETITTGSLGPRIEEEGLSERLGAAEWAALRPAIARAVDAGEDGESFAWRGPTGGAGTVVPIAAYFGDTGEVCRRLAITAPKRELVDVILAEACRAEDAYWRVTAVGPEV
jgi:surface antigen